MRKKQWVIYISAVFVFLFLCFGRVNLSQAAGKSKTVRVPYGYNDFLKIDKDGEVSGYYAEYLNELARINHWKYEYVKTTWPDAVRMLEEGKVDLLYPTNYSEERERTMDYPSLPVGYISVGVYALEGSNYKYDDYTSFDGARITYSKDSSNDEKLKTFAKEHGFSYHSVNRDTNYDMEQALKDGEADLAVFNVADNFEGGVLVSVMEADPVYLTVRKGNKELLSEINSGMQNIMKKKSELAEAALRMTLTGKNDSLFALSGEERKFVDSGEEITVGFYEGTEPLAYINEDGSYDGIFVALLNYMKEKSGLNLVPYPIKQGQEWQELVENGTIDFCIGASKDIYSAEKELCTTDSILDYYMVLVTQNDCSFNQIGKPVIALTTRQSNWEDFLRKRLKKELDFKYYQTSKECMLAVVNGDADASFINNLEFNYQIKNNRLTSLIRWPQYRFATEVCLVTNQDVDDVKSSTLNKAIGMLDDEYTEAVTEEYLNITYHSNSVSDYLYKLRIPLIIFTSFLIVMIVVFWTMQLYRKKQEKLREESRKREEKYFRILARLSREYLLICYTDLDADQCDVVRFSNHMSAWMTKEGKRRSYSKLLKKYINQNVQTKFREEILPFCDPTELVRKLQAEKDFFIRYEEACGEQGCRYFEMHFVDASSDETEHKMVFGIRCIDEIVKAEEQQKQVLKDALEVANLANDTKSDFLSKMSHDIRTPMNAIVGMTYVAEQHIGDDERVRDALSKISRVSHHMMGLINNVLDMSKIEAGKMSLNETEFDLCELLEDILEILQPQIKEHNHTFTYDFEHIIHTAVQGDSLRVQQALVNLLGNAIKYTPNGGEISLTVCEKEIKANRAGCYEFTIRDNGIGMTKELQEQIFEPFQRGEDQRISKIQGSGLGLPITRSIVQMMNGTIKVESELKKGSTFTMTIFLKYQDVKEDVVVEPKEVTPENYAGYHVLLVEDNELNREIAKDMLEMFQLEVDEAEDGQQAVEMYEQSEVGYYDMIFMDVQMPVMNGYEATQAIRAKDRADAEMVPIIAMTANAFVEDIEKSTSVGMNAHMSKPIVVKEIGKVLAAYMGG